MAQVCPYSMLLRHTNLCSYNTLAYNATAYVAMLILYAATRLLRDVWYCATGSAVLRSGVLLRDM
eukprot:1469041-Rhodomonas_salina.1